MANNQERIKLYETRKKEADEKLALLMERLERAPEEERFEILSKILISQDKQQVADIALWGLKDLWSNGEAEN